MKQFAKCGFVPDITHDAGHFDPQAYRLENRNPMAAECKSYSEKKTSRLLFCAFKPQNKCLENEENFLSKINQLSEINKIQETAIHQASEHASNLEDIIEIERSARLDLQQLFDGEVNHCRGK